MVKRLLGLNQLPDPSTGFPRSEQHRRNEHRAGEGPLPKAGHRTAEENTHLPLTLEF